MDQTNSVQSTTHSDTIVDPESCEELHLTLKNLLNCNQPTVLEGGDHYEAPTMEKNMYTMLSNRIGI